jgi:putative lipoic acid-binding regulatory protein
MSDKTTDAPKIEFPCQYPIKVICNAGEGVVEQVLAVVKQFDPAVDAGKLVVQPSKNGRFQSLRLTMQATSETQLQELHIALKGTGQVHMVL